MRGSLLLVSLVLLLNSPVAFCGCFKRIFSFGDSIIDTGNFVSTVGSTPIKELPYGMTYFNRSTGRVSDGRVIIDFYGEPPTLLHCIVGCMCIDLAVRVLIVYIYV